MLLPTGELTQLAAFVTGGGGTMGVVNVELGAALGAEGELKVAPAIPFVLTQLELQPPET